MGVALKGKKTKKQKKEIGKGKEVDFHLGLPEGVQPADTLLLIHFELPNSGADNKFI